TAAELLESVCALKSSPDNVEQLEEVYSDALVEAHLAMHDWERFRKQDEAAAAKPKPAARPSTMSPPRVHPRVDIDVSVKLRRFSVHEVSGAGMTVEAHTTSLPARNISAGGLYVVAKGSAHKDLVVGSVVMVTVSLARDASLAFRMRAVVTRRDDAGMGLRWIVDPKPGEHSVQSLLDAVTQR
ncbi:MAG TPA: PilZ domain-containing protein, partial [Polyangia bacterium]|nr:PilZ domain-containing protein [Polyangia bacterium]